VAKLFEPLAPFVIQTAVSMGAYTAGLAAAQGAGAALRISCATPVLGPLGGVLGVGFASALAGQASVKVRRLQKEGFQRGAFLTPRALLCDFHRHDVLLDAVLGIAAFTVMGGRFGSVMPSDLTKIGAIARESMPAAGMQYAGEEKKRELIRFFRRDGCHHCGTRSGRVIGDHMPPNKHVQEQLNASWRKVFGSRVLKLPYVQRVVAGMGLPTSPPHQRYYPQCGSCSQKQSVKLLVTRLKM